MLGNMFEVKKDKDLSKFTVGPVVTNEQENYLIICESEFDAKALCAQITMQLIPSPIQRPQDYHSNGVHPNGVTQVYELKSKK